MAKCIQTDYLNHKYFEEVSFDNENYSETIVVNSKELKHEILGFGGAFTEASGYVFSNSPKEIQDQIIKLYYDKKEGINYNLGRMSINSSDFGLGNYTYLPDGCEDLSRFSLERDLKYVIPMYKKAKKLSNQIQITSAPWSPPPFMKSNKQMNYGGKLLKEYYDLYAQYLVKYIIEMCKNGVDIQYLSLQNEPEATQTWDSCIYTPEEMIELAKIVYPKLLKENLDVKLIVLDHNRDILEKWVRAVSADEDALKIIWGVGIHWYVSEDFAALKRAKEIAPKLHILFTEGCVEGGVRPNSIETGERYARNIIGDINNGCIGYIDWNLVLDEIGGPNHQRNYCDAPMLVAGGKLIVNSSYYYIGHFSKYIDRGSRVLETSYTGRLQILSVRTPKEETVIVICNPNDEDYNYSIKVNESLEVGHIPSHTIQTWII